MLAELLNRFSSCDMVFILRVLSLVHEDNVIDSPSVRHMPLAMDSQKEMERKEMEKFLSHLVDIFFGST